MAVVGFGDEQTPVAAEGCLPYNATAIGEDPDDPVFSPVPEPDRPVVAGKGDDPPARIE
jgi:hypothetical protein